MTTTFEVAVLMTTIMCCHERCGIVFGVPSWWQHKRREDHTAWYCPNGHQQYFSVQSEAEKLKDQVVQLERRNSRLSAEIDQERAATVAAERSRRAVVDQMTRLRNRVQNGVCTECNRSFTNLARHMNTKHPHTTHD